MVRALLRRPLKISTKLEQELSSAPSITPSLEALPTEVQIEILANMANTKSLGSLVRASPVLHTIYLQLRNEIFTAVTFNELKSRSIDIVSPVAICEVTIDRKGWPPVASRWVGPAERCTKTMQVIYDHFKLPNGRNRNSSSIKKKLVLDVEQCLVLLEIQGLVPWNITFADDEGGKESIAIATKPKVAPHIGPLERGCVHLIVCQKDTWVDNTVNPPRVHVDGTR